MLVGVVKGEVPRWALEEPASNPEQLTPRLNHVASINKGLFDKVPGGNGALWGVEGGCTKESKHPNRRTIN